MVGGVILHWLNESQCFLVTSTSTGNTQGHGSSISHMGIVALTEKLNNTRAVVWLLEQQESKAHDSCSSNIIIHIRDRNVQQLSNCRVVPSPTVSHGNGVHARPS